MEEGIYSYWLPVLYSSVVTWSAGGSITSLTINHVTHTLPSGEKRKTVTTRYSTDWSTNQKLFSHRTANQESTTLQYMTGWSGSNRETLYPYMLKRAEQLAGTECHSGSTWMVIQWLLYTTVSATLYLSYYPMRYHQLFWKRRDEKWLYRLT